MADYIVVNGIRIASDFEPETFGRLTTIGPRFILRESTGKTLAYQVCECSCGKVVVIRRQHLQSGLIKSCKCMPKGLVIHGETGSAEYKILCGIKTRCTNPNRSGSCNYIERGIKVCDRWLEPEGRGYMNFLEDMGRRPGAEYTIERLDVNGDYCPENCRWATIDVQARNRRNNINLTAFGKTQCRRDWAAEYNISESTIRARLARGWDLEKALTHPIRYKK